MTLLNFFVSDKCVLRKFLKLSFLQIFWLGQNQWMKREMKKVYMKHTFIQYQQYSYFVVNGRKYCQSFSPFHRAPQPLSLQKLCTMINASPRMGHRAKNKMITAKEAIQTARIFKLQLITTKLPGARQRGNQMVATLEYLTVASRSTSWLVTPHVTN